MHGLTRPQEEEAMTATLNGQGRLREILEGKRAELVQALRRRDGITIEKSPDQSDEIQYSFQRDLTIRNLDRESNLLREVKAALRRIDDGDFGTCVWCEGAISAKRLAAAPWAPRCIQCQEAADRNGTEPVSEALLDAA